MRSVLALDPASFVRHRIHQDGRVWAETNCYTDLWIELLHGLGHEPSAALGFTARVDFEGDQWTFFKPPHADLEELYGVDVRELALWKPLAEHVEEQVALGRPVLAEVDAYYLPDTAGTAYRQLHWKTTIGVVALDRLAARMRYFHNQGCYEVTGEDCRGVLRLSGPEPEGALPPYVEFARLGLVPAARQLHEIAARLFARHLRAAPSANPFPRFRRRLEQDLSWLAAGTLEHFHQYSFATFRQFGAAFELLRTFLEWRAEGGEEGLDVPMRAFGEIAESAKALQFQLARSMGRRKPMDLSPLEAMGERWESGMDALRRRYC